MVYTPEQKRAAKLAAQRRWREKNGDRARQLTKDWRARNPEKVAADHAAWRKANPHKAREITRAGYRRWQEGDPERYRAAKRKANHIRRARMAGTVPDLTDEQWVEILEEFDHACAYCQVRDQSLEQEHVTPISRGGRHTKSNIVPACRSCNARKGARTLLEFAAMG